MLHLGADQTYRIDRESGRWSIWSNVGRATLMLRPADGGQTYGYVVTRESDHRVRLNGEPYVVRPAS